MPHLLTDHAPTARGPERRWHRCRVLVPYGAALLLLSLGVSMPTGDEPRAQRLAVQTLAHLIGPDAVARAPMESYRVDDGWLVILREVHVRCGSGGSWWPGACRPASTTEYQDAALCIDPTGSFIGPVTLSLGRMDPAEHPCANLRFLRPAPAR